MILKIDPVENLGVNRLSNILLKYKSNENGFAIPALLSGKAPFAYEGKINVFLN
jgi:hypothetical protein